MNLSKVLKSIIYNKGSINLYNKEHFKLVKEVYNMFNKSIEDYNKMYDYYKGDTDAIKNYKFLTERSNSKTGTNFIKKFIKEEVAYTVGNPITYESRSNDDSIIIDLKRILSPWDKNHEKNLMKYLLIFTKVFELYYFDNGELKARIIKPNEGYAYVDDFGKVLFFIRTYKSDFNNDKLIDVYTNTYIYHFNSNFEEIEKPHTHLFGEVPVSIGIISEEGIKDSIYNDIKGLQDAFETNLSDISNEISDFRNAYMKFIGCKVDENDLPKMKELGILQGPKDADISWLIKNINDTFIQNTLDREIDLMYQLACHINHNEKLQSNLSGITLRSRLIALENKCSLLIGCHYNMVNNRNRFICNYLNIKSNDYDYNDIKARYTPNIPQDDVATAQMLSQVPDGLISKKTGRSLFSFISNVVAEDETVKRELKDELDLIDDLGDVDE